MTEEEILLKFRIFGENIKNCRIKKGLTVKELSEKTKITEKHLIKIENGVAKRLNVSHVFAIAQGLEIMPHELCNNL